MNDEYLEKKLKELRGQIFSRDEIERAEQWRKWLHKIPFIQLKPEWKIKIIPPFASAIARFLIQTDKMGDKNVSVYLDCYDRLGIFGQPYWEIYPVRGDNSRVAMNDVDQLIAVIDQAVKELEEK